MKRYLLNSAVIGAGAYGTYVFAPASEDDLREFVRSQPTPISRIGYEETARLIEEITGHLPAPSREAVMLEPGDEAMVVRLKYRVQDPRTKGLPTRANRGDWEIARLTCLARTQHGFV